MKKKTGLRNEAILFQKLEYSVFMLFIFNVFNLEKKKNGNNCVTLCQIFLLHTVTFR